jgi:hypothetical protein
MSCFKDRMLLHIYVLHYTPRHLRVLNQPLCLQKSRPRFNVLQLREMHSTRWLQLSWGRPTVMRASSSRCSITTKLWS